MRRYLWVSRVPGEVRGCIGDVFSKVEFKYPLVAAISRRELEQDGKREVVAKAGLTAKRQWDIPVSARRVDWG